MQQYLAIAEHSPFRNALLTAHRSLGRGGLITPEEAAYIKKTQELDPSTAKVVFAVRPPRSLIRGVGGCAWNVCVGSLMAPLVALSMFPHHIHQHGLLKGLAPALIMSPVWGFGFAALGYTAAFQQLCQGAINQVAAPYHFLVSGKFWNLYTCRFERGLSSGDYGNLDVELPTRTLKEYAMRRVKRSQSDRDKRNAKYNPKDGDKKPKQQDLYEVLGLTNDATEKEIKEAYTKLAMKLHPDKNPRKDAHEQFDLVTKAYRTLSNPEKKRKYDLAGQDGVEDIGEKKREGVRALFGGSHLQPLLGDVRVGAYSQRVIDGLDFPPEELAVVLMRMMQTSRDTLLVYLDGCQGEDLTTGTQHANDQLTSPKRPAKEQGWNAAVRGRVHKFINTGLAKECLYVIGQEYLRACKHMENPSIVGRLKLGLVDVLPHRAAVRVDQIRALSKARPSMLKDTAILVDLAWYLSLSEIEYTARFAAMSLLTDCSLSDEERKRRVAALRMLATFFVASGQPYKGANKATVDQLLESLRSYQQAKRSSDSD